MPFKHKHKEGEWKVSDDNSDGRACVSIGDSYNCIDVWFIKSLAITEEEGRANAKLISTAPELLQFVEMFYDALITKEKDSMLIGMIEKILEKAGVEIEGGPEWKER